MAQDDQKTKEYPITDGRGVIVNLIVFGDQAVGKSSLLNAIFGDVLSDSKMGETTTALLRFIELANKTDNDNILNETKLINEDIKVQFEQDLIKHEKYKKKNFFMKQLAKFISGKVEPPQFPDSELNTKDVATSFLIPRKGALDNVFSMIDVPGFNGTFDDAIFKALDSNINNLDFIFYIIDCKELLQKPESKECFNKVFDKIKDKLVKGNTQLIILFNKFDTISVKSFAKKSVTIQKEELITKFKEANIPQNKYKFFNISATTLLVQRIVLTQDSEFLKSHPQLIDNIAVFCQRFMNNSEINKVQRKSEEEMLEIIYTKMMEHKQRQAIITDSVDEDEGQPPIIINNSESNDNDRITRGGPTSGNDDIDNDVNEEKEDLDEFLQFLGLLRKVKSVELKTQQYIYNSNIVSYKTLLEFFVCVFCLIQSKEEMNDNNNNIDIIMHAMNEQNQPIEFTLEKIMHEKLIAFVNNITDKKIECIEHCIKSLEYCMPSLNNNTFNLEKLIKDWTHNKHLNSQNIEKLKMDDDSKNEDNSEEYYYRVGTLYVDALMEYYKNNNGQSISDVATLINDIKKYYPQDTNKQLMHLMTLLSYYPTKTGDNCCRAIDLLLFHFKREVIKTEMLKNNIKDYKMLCAKLIALEDTTFDSLIKSLSQLPLKF